MSKHLIIGTAGHVDHGKTALVKALTQIECDTHPEEKKRGITINLGFAHINLPDGNQCGIVDVPGHKDFIQTMVAGTSGIDLIMLCIAADSGIMPQTREHLAIVNALGIELGVVVLTKSDLADDEWLEMLELEVRDYLQTSLLKNAPIVSVSAHKGLGMDRLVIELQKLARDCKPKPVAGNFRMYIDRLFNIKGHGFVATGSVLSGSLTEKDKVYLLPGGKEFNVKSVQRFGKELEAVRAGDRAAINLSGFKPEDFERGMILSKKELLSSNRADAVVSLFSDSRTMKKHSYVLFLSGTYQSKARMQLINCTELEAEQEAIVQFTFDKKGVFDRNDRFIIRNTSGDESLGGGYLLDPYPLHHRRPKPELIESLLALKDAVEKNNNEINLLSLAVKKAGHPLSLESLQISLGTELKPELFDELRLEQHGLEYFSEPSILSPLSFREKIEQLLVAALKDHHSKFYLLDEGLTETSLAGKCGIKLKSDPALVFSIILKSSQTFRFYKGTWSLKEFSVILTQKDREDLLWLEQSYLGYGYNKPVEDDIELAARVRNINKDKLWMYRQYLLKEKKLYHTDKVFLHTSIVDEARLKLVQELRRLGKGINEGEFRELIQATRKIVHPLLAIFIAEGIIEQEIYTITLKDKV